MAVKYSKHTKVKEIMSNPFGANLVSSVAGTLGVPSSVFSSPIIRNMPLSLIATMSKGMIDDGFIDTLCSKLNEYDGFERIDNPSEITRRWWKEAVFYQIYPSSFCDSNGDGIGDLKGITSKLDYLSDLGINAIWFSPLYKSPLDDNGYDISDYRDIHEQYGTLADFEEMLAQAHKRGIRVIMDLVVNHTSDEHEWFADARRSADSKYRDYYIWRDKPNNWQSMFSGSAWEYSEETKSYYLHTFSKKQCDLNWTNPNVRREVNDIVNYWYDKGVDGFRLDVINMIDKPDDFPDANEAIGGMVGTVGCEHYFYGPRAHGYLHDMYKATAAGRDVCTVGEMGGIGIPLARYFTAEQREELSMIFSFEHLYASGKTKMSPERFNLNHLKENLSKWQTEYGNACWNSVFLDNHDNPRMLSRTDRRAQYHDVLAKLLAVIELTLRGTPFIYQGQEIGMTSCDFKTLDEHRDVESLNYYKAHVSELGEAKTLEMLNVMSRDHARTPMQWSAEKNGGFTKGTPWLKVNENYTEINAAAQSGDENSVLGFYKKLIALRKSAPALVYGEFMPATQMQENLFCYRRTLDGEEYYIEINLCDSDMPKPQTTVGYTLLLSNYASPDTGKRLRAYEANIYRATRHDM